LKLLTHAKLNYKLVPFSFTVKELGKSASPLCISVYSSVNWTLTPKESRFILERSVRSNIDSLDT
jgi:hypothetical protein